MEKLSCGGDRKISTTQQAPWRVGSSGVSAEPVGEQEEKGSAGDSGDVWALCLKVLKMSSFILCVVYHDLKKLAGMAGLLIMTAPDGRISESRPPGLRAVGPLHWQRTDFFRLA